MTWAEVGGLTYWATLAAHLLFLSLFIWERQSENGGGAEREGVQRIQNGLCVDSRQLDAGLELMNCEIMTWAEVGSLTNWATQAPHQVGSFVF